jgi:O-antigen ligase
LSGKKGGSSAFGALLLFLLLVGGTLSVSKAFLLAGIPLFLVQTVLLHRSDLRKWGALAAMTVVLAMLFRALFEIWAGTDQLYLLSDLASSDDLLNLLTAGRFVAGSSTTVTELFELAWDRSFLLGLGYSYHKYLDLPLDNGYLEFFLQGGLVALACYIGMLVLLFFRSLSQMQTARDEGVFLLLLLIATVLVGFGAPVVTMNRFATVYWVVVYFLTWHGQLTVPVGGQPSGLLHILEETPHVQR